MVQKDPRTTNLTQPRGVQSSRVIEQPYRARHARCSAYLPWGSFERATILDNMRRVLLDTSVLIAVEPATDSDVETGSPAAAEFLRLLHQSGDQPIRHPASDVDLANDTDVRRRAFRGIVLGKYPELKYPPDVSASLRPHVGRPSLETNDWVDNQLLAAVAGDAVAFLITNDKGIHRKARRAGLAPRVLTVDDAMEFRREIGIAPLPPPAVDNIPTHALNPDDPIFITLREGYADWDLWFTKCRREGRECWRIDVAGRHAGVCIYKAERDEPYGLAGLVLKLCTFKIAPEYAGNGFGELLLKTAFDHVARNSVSSCYVEVAQDQVGLMTFLEDFGFEQLPGRLSRSGDLVYVKFARRVDQADELPPFEHHVRYGPPAIKILDSRAFVVPIRPQYHKMLFPEAEDERPLLAPEPYGNAIRKVYLCRSPSQQLQRGDSLLFYRSRDAHAVTSIGVLEDVLRSDEAAEVSLFAGNRTVYPYTHIERMSKKGDVLALRFRQDRLMQHPITLAELTEHKALKTHPQSITHIGLEGAEWIRRRIQESPF